MSQFYRIHTINGKAVKLEKLDGGEAELHFLTEDGQRVSVTIPQSQLQSLAKQIAEQFPAE